MTHEELIAAIQDIMRCLHNREFTGKIIIKDLEPEGYSVGFEVIQYRPLYISATLPDEEFLKYMKQELRNKAFIFARYYETTLIPDSNRPLAKFVR